MTTQLKAKLLQHFAAKRTAKKKGNSGFTLIELLVVIIIIGILSAIALPSFLNQANKAKQSEAKTYVGSMNRAQQAYYLEKGEFTDGLGDLGLGIRPTTDNYVYSTASTGATGSVAYSSGETRSESLKAYAGGVGVVNVSDADTDKTTIAVLCEASAAGTGNLIPPTITSETEIACGGGMDTIK